MDSIGRFIAHELRTAEVAAARGFYQRVFDWQVDDALEVRGGGPTWCRIRQGPDSGERALWLGYLTCPDLDEALEVAVELGATVLEPAHDDPHLGRVALLRDPDGSRFGLIDPPGEEPDELEARPAPGVIAWNVLISHDPERSLEFYMRLFGWTAARHELPGIGSYLICEREGLPVAGIVKAAADIQPEGEWLSAIAVTDVAAATAKALAAGAKPRWQPTHIPEVGRFSIVFDPTGARVAMIEIEVEIDVDTQEEFA